MLLLALVLGMWAAPAYAADTAVIGTWEMKWGQRGEEQGETPPPAGEGWLTVRSTQGEMAPPAGVYSAWTRVLLPDLPLSAPAVYVETLYALHVKVFEGGELIFEAGRDYVKDHYSLLVPVSQQAKELYIWTETVQDRLGIQGQILYGEHGQLISGYVRSGLIDVILGGAFVFAGLVLLLCAFYLNKEFFPVTTTLSVVIASTGVLAITYSPFIYTFYSEWGFISIVALDIALLSLLPALTYLFEIMFGPGRYGIIRRFRKFQMGYSAFCLVFMVINILSDNRFMEINYFISTRIIGVIMILQFVLLIAYVLMYALKGNKEAVIFAAGFGTAAGTGVGELAWYYIRRGNYDLFLWKWALVIFILSLIVILGRRLAFNHRQMVSYSRELEMFNNELQRSEKMEIISELAASVAHEVRNPLQVTRGFLQLLSEKAEGHDRRYMLMALSELDRASAIITDFLTFAKPELQHVTVLDLQQEFKHIESILLPLCHLNGGKLVMEVEDSLRVNGNSSKFKQAFINIIKNSIEALPGQGTIELNAYASGDQVFIHVKDDGEGMDHDVLERLGEPYFSQKTKGTGLGLMVTFRIIEAMKGKISFKSTKGTGTESVTVLPIATDADGFPPS